MTVTVLGSANVDLVAYAPRLPRPGETVVGGAFAMSAGGKGVNQAIAVARAGGECTVLTAVGDDGFAATLRDGLAAAGVRTDLVRTVAGPSGVALIAVDAAGENQIVVAPGAHGSLDTLREDELAEVRTAQALVAQLELPLGVVVQAALAAEAAGVPVVLNAAPARELPPELLRATRLLVVNRGEAEDLCGTGGAGVERLLDALLRKVPRVAITLGAEGAAYADRDGTRLTVPAPRITAVDTTAAGDAFVGALTVAWLEGRPIREAIEWACAAGAACARTAGAAGSLPARDAIDGLYAEAYR
jgi:ribokinase